MNMDTNLSSKIHQRLGDLFSWNPPQLLPRPLPGKKLVESTTRPLAYFDKHFSAKLQLRHVKHIPTLVHDITAVVDKIIAKDVNLHPLHHLYAADVINGIVRGIEAEAVDEKEVASYYERTTATFCIKAASLLAFGAPDLLRWSQSANVSGYAIADGFLYFANPKNSPDAYKQLEEDMGKETVDLIRALAEPRSSLCTQEFKNVAADGIEVMLAIHKLSNMPKFEWTVSTAPDCGTSPKHDREREKVSEVKNAMGHDANAPPWTLNYSDCHMQVSSQNLRSEKRKRDDDGGNQSRPNPSRRPEPSYAPDAPGGLRWSSRLVEQKSVPTNVTPVAKGKTTVQGTDGDGDGDFEDDPSYKDAQDLSALYIVQQAWAQATRTDCSILVIQAGNYEIIGIRHRLSQTLYISDLIKPHACTEPSYGKLHTSIYVAAAEDAIDRAKQRSTGRDGSNSGGPSGGPSSSRGDHNDDDEGDKEGGRNKPKEGSGKKKDRKTGDDMMMHEMATQRTLDLARRRDIVLLYLQYDVYDSPAPSTFVRSVPNGQPLVALPSSETVKNYRLEDCLSILLKLEIRHGATGTVLRGMLDIGSLEGVLLLDVVIKLALGREQSDALRNEYNTYNLLGEFGVTTGITTPLGLFDDVEGGACALLMPYSGTPLAAMPEFHLTPSYREAILATLKNIHTAGILHGDLRLENILVADSGHTIIDFAQSRVCHDPQAAKHEYPQLQSLLARFGKQKGSL